MMSLDLGGAWQFQEAESTDPLAERHQQAPWLKAQVPGCVHLDLMREGRIPDPFYGMNEPEVQWVARKHWLYRRVFDCPETLLGEKRVELVADGLDTLAHVCLNGERLGRSDNMFVAWRWDVTDLLRSEGNELLILFESPELGAQRLKEADSELEIEVEFGRARSYLRKAQYAGGWDWGPELNTSGVWRPIRLEGYSRGRIADVSYEVDWSEPHRPLLTARCALELIEQCDATMCAELTGHGTAESDSASCKLDAGTHTLAVTLPVEQPRLWWPAGFGEANLYCLNVELSLGTDDVTSRQLDVGLRQVELRREEDEEGESFVVHVNGEPIFCRGANWIPIDSFLPRATPGDYEQLVSLAADANMNMLRIWGGGIYEADEFFDACDRNGIMVWTDFMFACSPYPDHLPEFVDSVRVEAEQAIQRLRNHPSLVLWCGNNECAWLNRQYERLPGERIYEELLPELCERIDPTRPYWAGSPYGGPQPNAPTHGDQHNWSPWWGWMHPRSQQSFPGRFVSEFGFQAPPTLETIRDYIPAAEHHMQSRGMEQRQKARDGTARLYKLLSEFFRIPGSFEDTVYLMQLMQGEAVKLAVDYWRSRKFRTAGALFWQHNDCWPVTSWSCLDWKKRPKALYYYARRFFAPAFPILLGTNDGAYELVVVNDLPAQFEGEVIYGFGRLNGDQQWVERVPCCVEPNGLLRAARIAPESLQDGDPADVYLWCRLLDNGREVARNTAFMLPHKHLDFARPEWQTEVERLADRRYQLRLTNWCFAKGVWLRVEGADARFSDNYFDVFPELPTHVVIETDKEMEPNELKRRLRIRCVADTREAR